MNQIPCGNCFQSEEGRNHYWERIIVAEVEILKDLERRGDRGEVAMIKRQYIDQFLRTAHNEGWDGHSYNPMDNLSYIEFLANKKGLI